MTDLEAIVADLAARSVRLDYLPIASWNGLILACMAGLNVQWVPPPFYEDRDFGDEAADQDPLTILNAAIDHDITARRAA